MASTGLTALALYLPQDPGAQPGAASSEPAGSEVGSLVSILRVCQTAEDDAAVLKLCASVDASWMSTVRDAGSPGLLATASHDDQKFASCAPIPLLLGSPYTFWICVIVALAWSRLASDPCWSPAWISMKASRNLVTELRETHGSV